MVEKNFSNSQMFHTHVMPRHLFHFKICGAFTRLLHSYCTRDAASTSNAMEAKGANTLIFSLQSGDIQNPTKMQGVMFSVADSHRWCNK